ncbi:hypothetical protein R1flu_024457 [Riccia fluitans]|uniref:Uncharacterized protein n=1 Tax=Riccia fluitans TaxID=41844 RepID=A0ABD1XUZ0_9MARC
MHCAHAHASDCNGATRTPRRRRNKVSEIRPGGGHRTWDEEHNLEASLCQQLYPGMSGITYHGAHGIRGSRGYESSDLQSLDDSIARAEIIEADLDAPTPELKTLRRQEEVLQTDDACRGRRYDTSANFLARSETHPEDSNGLIHEAAWGACGGGSQAHKLVREIKDRLNQSEVQMRRLREERDNAVHQLMSLSGKITNCTELAEEQAKLLEEQSETISNLESKVQVLAKAKQEARHEQKKNAEALDDVNQRMQSECTEYEKKIQGLENTIERLRTEKEEHGETVRGFEVESKRVRNELNESVEIIQKVEVSNKRLQLETKELIHKIQNLEQTIQSLQMGAEDHIKKIQTLEDTNQRLRGGAEEQRQKLKVMEDTNQRLRADAQELSEKIKSLEDSNQRSSVLQDERVRMLEDSNQRLQVEREAQTEKLRSCEGVNQVLRVERDSCKENIRTLEETIQRLRREREECIERFSTVEESNRVMRAQEKDYREELQSLEENNRRLQVELQNHEETTKNLKDENQHFRMEILEMEEKVEGLEEHNQLLRVEFTEYIQKLQRSEDQQRLQSELREQHRLQAELRVEMQKIRSVEDKCRSLMQENMELKEKVKNQEDNTGRLKAQHNLEMRRTEESNDCIQSEYKKQIAALEEDLELQKTRHTEKTTFLQKNVQQLKEEVIVLEERMKDMKAKHKSDNTRRKSNDKEVEVRCYKEITKLKKCIEDMECRYGEERAALKEQISLHQQRAVIQDEKIEKVMHKMNVAKSELSKARTREAELKANVEIQETAYQQKLKECHSASKEIQELTGVKAELREKAEAMDQLCVDNARLVQLLAESEEYQNFLTEMEEGNGMVFCPSQFKGSKFKILAQRYGALTTRGSVNPKTERELWIPADLYDLAMAFRREHSWEIAVEELQELLRLINTFWHEREKKHMVKTKMKYERQISEMKRHQMQRIPYEQVIRSSLSRPAPKGNGSTSSSKISLECGDQDEDF